MLRGTKRLRGGAVYLRGDTAELYSINGESGAWRIRRLAVAMILHGPLRDTQPFSPPNVRWTSKTVLDGKLRDYAWPAS